MCVAKTTKEETIYQRGYAVRVSTAMKAAMEAERWAPALKVCCQTPDAMPSDTCLHHLLVDLLDVQVQVDAPLHAWLWEDHQHVSLHRCHGTGVIVPTIVWLFGPTTVTC